MKGTTPACSPRPHLDQALAGAQDEASIRVANASGEFAESTRVARVRVSAKQHLPDRSKPEGVSLGQDNLCTLR